jgi:hypothetical protein
MNVAQKKEIPMVHKTVMLCMISAPHLISTKTIWGEARQLDRGVEPFHLQPCLLL